MKIGKLFFLFLLTLTGSLVSAQDVTRCGGPTNALSVNWPNLQFDVCHTGYNPYENILSPDNVSNLVLDWKYPVQYGVSSSPAIVNGVVYFGTEDGNFYALDARTGTHLWAFSAGSRAGPFTSPAVVNSLVYFGAGNHEVYALNSATGALVWSYTTGSLGGVFADSNKRPGVCRV